ncbi:MAG TPA: hypothetical protein VGW38_27465 [Chloroflexota bacterium]|nr:hypothetical protein [Chloroflexota bacterium]
MNVQYQQERQVTATIDKYHHEAMRVKQVRLAQGDQPGRLATITMSLRATLGSVQARFHRVPVVAPEPVAAAESIVAHEPVVTPAESIANA